MHPTIENIRKTRTWLLENITDLSIDQLNKTPKGFNNNIIWNIAHLIAAQQGLCYVRASLQPVVEEKYFIAFKSGTRPVSFVDVTEFEKIKELLFTSLDQLEIDLDNNIFKDYTIFKTRYGVEINDINDCIAFLTYHEGMHTGVISQLKKLVVST
ncbi:MAG: DinB family protein [Ferruginibacter sp.]